MAEGKYRFDALFGGGGMAEVFAASKVGAEGFVRRVAIKRVLPGFSDDPEFAKMFVAEAQISSKLVHPNIVSVLDFDRDAEGRLFLVMELVEGRDLDALAATGLVPFNVLIYVMVEVLRGLGHAHDLPVGGSVRGVVHRDVSPHNILLGWEGAVKVSDFGIAKARDASAATASTLIKGKPAYMSPEQANGQALDGRSDLFAVGVMMWELLVGRRLFVAEDTRGTLAAVMFGKIPRPRSVRPEVPKDLERIVMKLLERDLPARYASAEPAIAELLKCADARGGRDAMTALLAERFAKDAPVRKASTPRAVAAEAATVASSPRAQRKPRPWRWVIVGVVAAAVAGGAYAVMARVRGGTTLMPDAGSGKRGHANGEGWFRVGAEEFDSGTRDADAGVKLSRYCDDYTKELERVLSRPQLLSKEQRDKYAGAASDLEKRLSRTFAAYGNTTVEDDYCDTQLIYLRQAFPR